MQSRPNATVGGSRHPYLPIRVGGYGRSRSAALHTDTRVSGPWGPLVIVNGMVALPLAVRFAKLFLAHQRSPFSLSSIRNAA